MNKNLSGKKKLALVALFLGFIALFAGDPYKKTNIGELDKIEITSSDKINVLELADRIINGRADFQIIDVRENEKYNEYFIPSAINLKNDEILNVGFEKNEKLILYSENENEASEVLKLLKLNGYKGVKLLEGGIEKWKKEILFPTLGKNASEKEILEFKKISEISKYFGGTPSDGGNQTKIVRKMPKLSAPVKVNLNKSKKRKREGC